MPTNLGAGTNETRIVVMSQLGFTIYESAPMIRVAFQPNVANLQSQLVCYGYYAWASRQPKLITVISGTGCIPISGY